MLRLVDTRALMSVHSFLMAYLNHCYRLCNTLRYCTLLLSQLI
uniref:Uncharacterized protein n=1 Tax=Lotus japonicus TaxID=34305 RepID=I3RZA7_LOTJA|nr:unknown [Lotus japonicus]